MSNLIHLGTSFNPVQAHLIKDTLEANDIPCFLFDQESFNAMSAMSLAIGGIRIMVHKDDVDDAKAILKEIDEVIEK